MDKPVIKQDPLYQLLRTEDIKGFNEQRDQLDTSELKNGDYRGRDLRNMNAAGLDFSDAYFARPYATPGAPIPLALAVLVFAPLFEELFFRGFLFTAFERSRLGAWGAIVAAAGLFALSHAGSGWMGVGSMFLLGAYLGAARHVTGSVRLAVLLHALYNGIVLLPTVLATHVL